MTVVGTQYAAVGPHTASPQTPSLRVQTDGLCVPQRDYPLSTRSDPGQMRSPYSPPQEIFPEYAINYADLCRPQAYSESCYSTGSLSPVNSQSLSSPPTTTIFSDSTWSPRPPHIPRRSPGHTLGLSLMPIIATAIPKIEDPAVFNSIPTGDWEQFQWQLMANEYLRLGDSTQPLTAGAKWSRRFFPPTKTAGRKLAGQWDLGTECESRKSISTAPTILV
jgi:hypothetical protein